MPMPGPVNRATLEQWLQGKEDEHCEFKEARNNIDSHELTEYCLALANEGGGNLVLGVSDAKPRQVVGSQACCDLEGTKHTLLQRIHLRIDAVEFDHSGRRVVVFSAPSRPIGTPLQYKGRYLMRSGSSLVSMTPEQLGAIFAEAQPDFSADVCERATLADLDEKAIERLRRLWHRKSGNDELLNKTREQLLTDAELIDHDGSVTYAALILLGTHRAMGRCLANAEVIYEYRRTDASIPYQHRREYRQGFLLFDDEFWNEINARNEVQQVRSGLFISEIQAFNEEVVREGLLNAVCHRDYRRGESVFVRQYPKRLEIESPGGFPVGVTPENILDRQNPRNRRIAETFQKCGLVERSGQGADKMFRLMIEESKRRPDFSESDEHRVLLRLDSEIQDPEFLEFLNKVGKETRALWSVHDLIVLDDIRQNKVRSADERVRRLAGQGVVELIGRGRGTRYILSKRYYTFVGQKGKYTRSKGLDRETNKALILKHLENHGGRGKIGEFEEVLPNLTRPQIHGLLKELKGEGKMRHVGGKRHGHWETT
jgi:ATP-dependent DNA helicase RecG